jgi:hypothetical protein
MIIGRYGMHCVKFRTVGKIKKGVEYEDVNPEDIIAINTPNKNEENEEKK